MLYLEWLKLKHHRKNIDIYPIPYTGVFIHSRQQGFYCFLAYINQ
ncbi:Uncharacterised protein [Edwardsiella tarda]|nr:Uncharacterised protein [Edwardsiella tarda]